MFQSIASPDGTLAGLPADSYDLFRQAYRPSNPASVPDDYDAAQLSIYNPLQDARTHNNSYGLGIPVADLGDALRADQFVWDHEDMNIIISASNGGPGTATITAPGVAKNILTSAASANGRQPMASIDSLAVFSSHGPTGDGRFGPTVATPGQIVLSAKGGGEDEAHTLQGTSMSAPVLTGLATLVREYFWNGWGPADGKGFGVGSPNNARRTNPSAALVKAAFVNGAERMRGYYTGTEGESREMDGQWPSAGQGFGLVNMDNSLFFAGDDLNNWYYDVYRADEEAFPFPGALETRSYTLNVEAGQPLDVTMSYTDAPTGLDAGTPATVNDLNLLVTGPDGTPYAGNNFNTEADPTADVGESIPGPVFDNKNTTERVRIVAPEAGEYTVEVIAAALFDGPQGFALAASGALTGEGAPTRGSGLQPDQAGGPSISNIRVEQVTGDTAWVRWNTSEPTTGTVTVGSGAGAVTYIDSYNVGPDGFHGLDAGNVETSEEYANKPMLTTKHEALLTGLTPGAKYTPKIDVVDQTDKKASATGTQFTSSPSSFGADADDIAQLAETNDYGGFQNGTQMYVGKGVPAAGNEDLGAFMFRLPKTFDPSKITGAAIQLKSWHDITNTYKDDARYIVDLLPGSVEADWQNSTFQEIREPAPEARLAPMMADRIGAGQPYTFSFDCSSLSTLKDTLTTLTGEERDAAFRAITLSEEGESLMSYEFGFNRRSQGPQNRPKLILFTQDADGFQVDPFPCDENAPAPVISNITVAPAQGDVEGIAGASGSSVVTWKTTTESDSAVMFREVGAEEWAQVSSPVKTTHHMLQVKGLNPTKKYEFIVRSTNCNGKSATDTNSGAGYDFFEKEMQVSETQLAPTFTWESSDEGWTTQSDTATPGPFNGSWERAAPGHDSTMAFHLTPYGDNQDESLISPSFTTSGGLIEVDFWALLAQEEGFDPVNVEYSTNGGTSWTIAASYLGNTNGEFEQFAPSFEVPAGNVKIRFRLVSDTNVSFPPYEGVAVDDVTITELTVVEPGTGRLTEGMPPLSAGNSGLQAPAAHLEPTTTDIVAGTASCAPIKGAAQDLKPPRVKLHISDRTPKRGQRIALKVRLAACNTVEGKDALAGTEIALTKRKKGGGYKTIATKTLNDNCKAKFKKKARFKKATFRATWAQQNDLYRDGKSKPRTVKTHKR